MSTKRYIKQRYFHTMALPQVPLPTMHLLHTTCRIYRQTDPLVLPLRIREVS